MYCYSVQSYQATEISVFWKITTTLQTIIINSWKKLFERDISHDEVAICPNEHCKLTWNAVWYYMQMWNKTDQHTEVQ
jgi:hypothetical protein